MAKIDDTARAAGFVKADEINTSSVTPSASQKVGSFCGMDIVSKPWMPDGFLAMRTDAGAMVVGPKGSYWVPFFPPATPKETDQ